MRNFHAKKNCGSASKRENGRGMLRFRHSIEDSHPPEINLPEPLSTDKSPRNTNWATVLAIYLFEAHKPQRTRYPKDVISSIVARTTRKARRFAAEDTDTMPPCPRVCSSRFPLSLPVSFTPLPTETSLLFAVSPPSRSSPVVVPFRRPCRIAVRGQHRRILVQ